MKNPLIVLLVMTFVILTGCKKDPEIPEAPDVSIFDVSDKTDWDYWVVGKDGDNIFVNVNNNRPTSVFYTPDPNQTGYSVFFDENGYPNIIVKDDHILIFENFSGTQVDAALVLPDGNIKIARNVETGINWDESFLKSASADPSDWLRWTGHALSAGACAAGVLLGPATFGVSWVVTGIGCGATLVSVIAEFLPEDYELLGLSASTIGSIATAVGCVDDLGLSCALGTSATAFSLMSLNQEKLEEANDAVQVAVAALEHGYGDIQITLTWDNIADLDLRVVDPYGEVIYWNHDFSASNGKLDVDDINGYGPENIYWPSNGAPRGTYEVYVHHYPWNESDYQAFTGNVGYPVTSNYTVLINAFGDIKRYSGSISFDEVVYIRSFDQNGLKSASATSTFTVTTAKVVK
jgi:hypothetical protein